MNKIAFYSVIAIFALIFSTSIAHAAVSGASSITSYPEIGGATAGQVVTTVYEVDLASGLAGNTSIYVSNNATLAANGITVSLGNPSGDPPYFGVANVTTSNSTPPGTYFVMFVAAGADPSASPFNYSITVYSPDTTTIGAHPPVTPALPLPQIIAALIVIVAIVIIVLVFKFAR